MTSPTRGRIWRRCSCGATCFAAARPAELADGIAALFDELHHGPGHTASTPEPVAEIPGQGDLLDLLPESRS